MLLLCLTLPKARKNIIELRRSILDVSKIRPRRRRGEIWRSAVWFDMLNLLTDLVKALNAILQFPKLSIEAIFGKTNFAPLP